jgi:hypothetical protein
MTEHRPSYLASSQDADQLHLAQQGRRPIIVPEFPPSVPDILLLLPMLESSYTYEQDPVCLHLIHLPNGDRGLCNAKSTRMCPCCGFAMCRGHESERLIDLPDEQGIWSDHYRLLCEVCAALTHEQIYAYHAFRTSINQQPGTRRNKTS